MNIYSKKGDKVTVTESSATNGYEIDQKQVSENLEIGKEYTVEYTDVHSYHTRVKLQEIPRILFNSVNLINIENT